MAERITSRQNPLCGHIKKLTSSRAYRRKAGEFVAEGPKLLSEVLAHGGEIRTLVYREGWTPPADLPGGVRLAEVPADLLAHLSDTEAPQGVLAVCAQPGLTPPAVLPEGRCLVLDGVQDPGNVGTVWRTADAFGAAALVLLPGCADPWGPKTVRATMGACFRLPVWEAEPAGLPGLLGDMPLYAAALGENTGDVREADLTRAAVVIGSEGRGVSQEVLALCARTLKIPMRSRCESLNAAVAAAVVLWEGWRSAAEG